MTKRIPGATPGRKSEDGERRIRGSITLSREEWAALATIGHGNRSAGVRALLAASKPKEKP